MGEVTPRFRQGSPGHHLVVDKMVTITAPCTCTVDGYSSGAHVSYLGYTFAGCGAHRGYNIGLKEGAGYHLVWCYVTEPEECESGSPLVPDGLQTKNTLPEWEAQDAAWKACYDGYRCEAWWGSLNGTLVNDEPIVLDAPLDWPDCCALCSESSENSATSPECVGWSFDPSTGECQLKSSVSSTSSEGSWNDAGGIISGYPGYFEPPVSGCWSRSSYDLCMNMNLGLIIPGCILSFIGLICMVNAWICLPPKRYNSMRNLLQDKCKLRLEKARPLQVTGARLCTRIRGKGGASDLHDYNFMGTFTTRNGALFEIPHEDPVGQRVTMETFAERQIEQNMLKVLFETNLQPLSEPEVARRCQTPDGLRSEFRSLLRRASKHPVGDHHQSGSQCLPIITETRSSPESVTGNRGFHCLLLVGRNNSHSSGSTSAATVRLVGILGEDRLTCITPRLLENPDATIVRDPYLVFFLGIGDVLLIILCVALLTSEASQVMASFTFPGTDYRSGAYVGLVLCTFIPLIAWLWRARKRAEFMRLVEEMPGISEED